MAGRPVALGNAKFPADQGIPLTPQAHASADDLGRDGQSALFLAVDGVAEGVVAVADVIRDEAPAALAALKKLGVRRLILLTGDNERVAAAIAGRLGISEYQANLLPQDKIALVQALQRAGHAVAMIGDGVNDAPALAQADVGIAMGVVGSDVALEAAHVALMRDDWSQVPAALRMGRRNYRVIRQNIVLGIAWDFVTMGLASIGVLSPVMAAATEALPDVLVSLISARLLKAPR